MLQSNQAFTKVYFTVVSLAICSIGQAQPGLTPIEPLPGYRAIVDLATSGDIFVASGSITRQANGEWVDNGGPLRVFAYADGKFHGWRLTANFNFFLQTSADGITWTDLGTKEFDGITSAAYNDGEYLVTFKNFNNDQIFISTDDGITWTETNGALASSGVLQALEADYGFGKWFLLGPTGGLASSPDGINWTAATVPAGTPTGFSQDVGMAFGGTVGNEAGLASAQNALLRTDDGVVWTEVDRFSNGLFVNDIAYNNGSFLLGRTDFSQRFILESSSDLGLTFDPIAAVHFNRLDFIEARAQVRAIAPWKTGFAVAGDNGFVLGTEDLALGEAGFQRLTDASLYHYDRYPFQLVANGSTLARYFQPPLGSSLPRRVQTSTDGGFNWSAGTTDLAGIPNTSVEFLSSGGKYFLRNFRGLSVSSDAVNWTKAVSTDPNPEHSTSDLWTRTITYDGTRWLAVIEEDTGPDFRRFITASSDGISWTKVGTNPAGPTDANERLLFVGDRYFFISTDYSTIRLHSSKDLTNWTLLSPTRNSADTSVVRIAKNGNQWLIQGLGANRVSTDGITFFDVPNGSINPMPIGAILESNGKFYAPGNDSILVSDDIFFWEATDGPFVLQDFLTSNANGLLLTGNFDEPVYLNATPQTIPPPSTTLPAIAITQTATGTLKISIPTEIDSFYYVQENSRLDLPLWDYNFTDLPFITGDGTTQEVEFTPSGGSGFYRVEVFSY